MSLFLPYHTLQARADDFLRRYHPEGSLPVPIEEIAEFRLGLNIIPVPGLHRSFEIDGFTSGDLQDISVDESIYENHRSRYRFTLAHEVGHIVLHRHLYEGTSIRNAREWKKFINDMPLKDHSSLEFQAYAFAGLVLVPPAALFDQSKRLLAEAREPGAAADPPEVTWTVVTYRLTQVFDVSFSVIEKRLAKDRIVETLGG